MFKYMKKFKKKAHEGDILTLLTKSVWYSVLIIRHVPNSLRITILYSGWSENEKKPAQQMKSLLGIESEAVKCLTFFFWDGINSC